MPLAYFDSSALVKLLIDEPGSALVEELWDGCDAPCASRLAHPEVRAALAAAARNGTISSRQLTHAKQSWGSYWPAIRPVELSGAVELVAGEMAETHRLRGADAVHLSSALALEDPDLLLVAWDRRLREGAFALGLTVAPHSIGER